jgi:hypothetical protein
MIPFLNRLRLVLAIAGMIFLLIGIGTDSRLIVWCAIGLLAAAFLLRLYLRKVEQRS